MAPEARPRNRLLQVMPASAYAVIAPWFRMRTFEGGHVLHLPGEEITHVQFPLDSMVSITVTMKDGRTSEAGVVGRREMAGINAFMGGRETTQTEYVIQIPGTLVEVPAQVLRDEFDRNVELRSLFLRFTQAMFAQITQNTACNNLHSMENRFARWLLEVRDRVATDDLRLTHAFMAEMLGVRRAGITTISGQFAADGLITNSRGETQIRDRQGLEMHACECYRVILEEYDRLLGPEPGSTNANGIPAIGQGEGARRDAPTATA